MQGKRVIQSISVKNILSYGSEGVTLEFESLNVLIGPNGSGKSNFLETFRLLKVMPHDLSKPVIAGGGIQDWLWKGNISSKQASISSILYNSPARLLQHQIVFGEAASKLRIFTENIEFQDSGASDTEVLYSYSNEEARIHSVPEPLKFKPFKSGYVRTPATYWLQRIFLFPIYTGTTF